jgi:hypothetical protein
MDTYIYQQNQDMKSIQDTVARLYDGWFIREDTFAWDSINECWVIRIYPESEERQWDLINNRI